MPKVVKSTILDAPIDAVWDGAARLQRPRKLASRGQGQPDRARLSRRTRSAASGAFTWPDGSELREQLLTLSDLETAFSYCLLETPVPLFNYVAHVRLMPVTDGDRTFWQWESRFDTRAGEAEAMSKLVGEGIYEAGFAAVKQHMGLA